MPVLTGRTQMCSAVAAIAVAALLIVTGSTAAPEQIAQPLSNGQRFVPDVVGAFNGLSTRADALAFRRGDSPEATLCKHYQGIARKTGSDGTTYLFLTKSGNIPSICVHETTTEDGYLIVVRMGSRGKHGERLGRNLYPHDGADDFTRIPTDDRVVASIPLDGVDGRPGYRHPGGMQLLGDVLAIGAENPVSDGQARAAILFFDVSDPEHPSFITQFDPPDLDGALNWGFGADPVGLTAVRDQNDRCCRYLMVSAGGPAPDSVVDLANVQVRFYLSDRDTRGDRLKSGDLVWTEVGKFSEAQLEAQPQDDCLGVANWRGIADWPTGTGTQHQMLNFVREGSLGGRLFLVAGLRDGPVVDPFSDEDEFLDLYEVHLTPAQAPDAVCPLSFIGRKRVGLDGIGPALQSWGDFVDVGSFAAGSGVYITPSGEVSVYVTDHRTTIFGEYRPHSLVRANSPTLHPTASVDGPFTVAEGGTTQLTGQGEPPITKAFVQLFEDTGAGSQLTHAPWLNVEYQDRDLDQFDDLCKLNLGNNAVFDPCGDVFRDPLWDKVSSVRWFAPPGCNIQANDFPTRSGNFPGEHTVILRGTGQVEEVHDLANLRVHQPPPGTVPPWPVSPPPSGTGEDYNYTNDIEGVTFYEAYRAGGSVVRVPGCDSYYDAPIGLGWDLDDNGSFETGGTSVTFDAASLDGPTTGFVHARAQHPNDTTPLGVGAPELVLVDVRNVAPTIAAVQLTSDNRQVGGPGAPAVPGRPLELEVTFTDPGRADTQTATVDWGDGTVDSTFDSYSDAHGGAVGRLRQAHTFASKGTYNVVTTITDDDGGFTALTVAVEVRASDIAFVRGGDIWKVSPETGAPAPVQLTSGPAIDAEPAWSPDRTKIAFSSSRSGNGDIYVLDLGTGTLTRLTTSSAIDTSPAWSPDGSKIAFASNRAGGFNFEIYVMDAASGEADPLTLTRVTNHPAADTLPSWSPSGLELAFMSFRTGNGDIYTVPAVAFSPSNPAPTRLTFAAGLDAEPDWSPSGIYIAFSTTRHGSSNAELYVVRVSDRAETRLTNLARHQITPSWSQDGLELAFMSTSTGNGDIYTAPVGNTPALIPLASQKRITFDNALELLPDW